MDISEDFSGNFGINTGSRWQYDVFHRDCIHINN